MDLKSNLDFLKDGVAVAGSQAMFVDAVEILRAAYEHMTESALSTHMENVPIKQFFGAAEAAILVPIFRLLGPRHETLLAGELSNGNDSELCGSYYTMARNFAGFQTILKSMNTKPRDWKSVV